MQDKGKQARGCFDTSSCPSRREKIPRYPSSFQLGETYRGGGLAHWKVMLENNGEKSFSKYGRRSRTSLIPLVYSRAYYATPILQRAYPLYCRWRRVRWMRNLRIKRHAESGPGRGCASGCDQQGAGKALLARFAQQKMTNLRAAGRSKC